MGACESSHPPFCAELAFDGERESWIASVPAVDGCAVQAGTRDEAVSYLREMLAAILDEPEAQGLEIELAGDG